jgi:transcriptional regulator with XRE-family HTH domain
LAIASIQEYNLVTKDHPRKDTAPTLSERIKELLRRRRRSIYRAAEETGLGYATMHGLASGKRRNPSRETLETIARTYRVSIEWLLGGDGAEALETAESSDTNRHERRMRTRVTDTRRELWRRLDAIDADDSLTPAQKMLKREQELAAYRMGTQDREARAAVRRSRALEREMVVAERRTASLQDEAVVHVTTADEGGLREHEVLRQMLREELEAALRTG